MKKNSSHPKSTDKINPNQRQVGQKNPAAQDNLSGPANRLQKWWRQEKLSVEKERLLSYLTTEVFRLNYKWNELLRRSSSWRIGFLSEEYHQKDLTPVAEQGATVKFITEHLNNHDGPFKSDILLGERKDIASVEVRKHDSARFLVFPQLTGAKAQRGLLDFLNQKPINLLIGLDHSSSYEFYLKNSSYIPWVVWIKDPKDNRLWEKLEEMPLIRDGWKKLRMAEQIQKAERDAESLLEMVDLSLLQGRKIYFATESNHLTEIARRQYGLNIKPFHWPKPITLPKIYRPGFSKKPSFLFLSRLDPVKRPWIYFEVAKKFPDADFYVAGKSHAPEIMNPVLVKYGDVPNLKFIGLAVEEEKKALLNSVWAVINTSIYEASPASFLEAFSYGKPVIAALNPDQLASRFGVFIGEVSGHGDSSSTERFCEAVENIINGKIDKETIGGAARKYIAEVHSFYYFETALQRALKPNSGFEFDPRRNPVASKRRPVKKRAPGVSAKRKTGQVKKINNGVHPDNP